MSRPLTSFLPVLLTACTWSTQDAPDTTTDSWATGQSSGYETTPYEERQVVDLHAVFGDALVDGIPTDMRRIEGDDGVISPAGDRDVYEIEGKAGHTYTIILSAAAFDPLLRIYRHDSVPTTDAIVVDEAPGGVLGETVLTTFTPELDGPFFLEVMTARDWSQENGFGSYPTGGPNHTYKLWFGTRPDDGTP